MTIAVADALITALQAENAALRAALAGLIGSDDPDELRAMDAVLCALPIPAGDKVHMREAIRVLLSREGHE